MPYKFIREQENVPCTSTECLNNDCGTCTAEVNIEDLWPSRTQCEHYSSVKCDILLCKHNTGEGYCELNDDRVTVNSYSCTKYDEALTNMNSFVFVDEKGIEDFLLDYGNIPVIEFDANSLRLLYCKIVYSSNIHKAFIRISEKDQELYDYKPHVDGSILLVPKNQTTLDL